MRLMHLVKKPLIRKIHIHFAGVYNIYVRMIRKKIERDADVIIFSFPKSGRTWLRLIIAKYYSLVYGIPLSLEIFEMASRSKKVPKILFTHVIYTKKIKGKNILDIDRYKKNKLIFLVRDPRDIIVSYFFHVTKRRGSIEYGDMNSFAKKEFAGLINFINSFAPFVGGRVHLVRYEDLKKNTSQEVYRILACLGEADPVLDKIDEAVNFCKFNNMRKMELEGQLDDDRLSPGCKGDVESYKVRRGIVGGYRDYLDDRVIMFMDECLKKLNKKFGYYD